MIRTRHKGATHIQVVVILEMSGKECHYPDIKHIYIEAGAVRAVGREALSQK